MKIIETLKNNIKRVLGYETENLFTHAGAGNTQALRWERSSRTDKQKPIYCVLSHNNNFNEINTLLHTSNHLQQALGSQPLPDIVFLSAQNSHAMMESEVLPTLSQEKASHIITPGIWSTQRVAEKFEYSGLPAPLIFTGVSDIRRVTSQYRTTKNRDLITGVQHRPIDYTEFVAGMKDIVPGTRRILVPFDREITCKKLIQLGYGLNDTQRAAFDNKGIQVMPVPVAAHDNLDRVLSPLLRNGDGILIANDSTALVSLDDIRRAAERKKLPVFAENSMAVLRGASFGIGGCGASDAPSIAHSLYSLGTGMVEKASDLPITTVNRDQEIRFNATSFEKQGIVIDSKRMRALNMRSIVAGE